MDVHTELAVRPLICLPHIGRYKVVGNVFGLSSNVSMVINVVNLTSIGRDPPSLWLETGTITYPVSMMERYILLWVG